MGTDDRLDALAETGRNLEKSVDKLTRGLRSNRRRTIILAVSLVLDLAITITLATVLSGQADTNRRIRESLAQNYITETEQQATRLKVLCPVWTFLLALPASPKPAAPTTPAQQAQLAAGALAFRDGYITLGCLPKLP